LNPGAKEYVFIIGYVENKDEENGSQKVSSTRKKLMK